eukprot:6268854-Amphidinium_carterae.1
MLEEATKLAHESRDDEETWYGAKFSITCHINGCELCCLSVVLWRHTVIRSKDLPLANRAAVTSMTSLIRTVAFPFYSCSWFLYCDDDDDDDDDDDAPLVREVRVLA